MAKESKILSVLSDGALEVEYSEANDVRIVSIPPHPDANPSDDDVLDHLAQWWPDELFRTLPDHSARIGQKNNITARVANRKPLGV